MSQDAATPDPLREDLRSTVEALAATIQALTQATQVLRSTAEQLTQAVPAGGGPGRRRTAGDDQRLGGRPLQRAHSHPHARDG